MELYEPIEVGPLSVDRLSLTFPGLRFPIDLSGGVPRFRSRRGELQELVLRLRLAEWVRYVGKRLGEPLGPLVKPLAAWNIPGGIALGLVGERSALAFDLLWAPESATARFVVARARSSGLPAPSLAAALRVCDALVAGVGTRTGRVLHVPDVAIRIGRALLPAVGARAPSAAGVNFGELRQEQGELSIELDATFAPPGLGDHALRALELSRLSGEADAALAESRVDDARRALLEALEQAPRHPEIVRTLCELDAAIPGRHEAALGFLTDLLPEDARGAIGAEALAAAGNPEAAVTSLERAASDESFAPLAALWLLRAAELCDASRALDLLDRAVAASPTLLQARKARLSMRLARRDLSGALADAEHLEAMAQGAVAKHGACLAAAKSFLDAGQVKEAGRVFERALRYMPDDAAATVGLGRSALASGLTTRAITLFERAIALSEKRGEPDARALLELSRLLAEKLADLPQAIARLRRIPGEAVEAEAARHLEGMYRAKIGDLVGASLAFAKLRERVELTGATGPDTLHRLRDAARFELAERDDPALAERHLALALRLAPHDPALADEYRRAAHVLDLRQRRT
jgi:tetratricopeptide (TPR) repeat protein